MNVVLHSRVPCAICGYQSRVIDVANIRINKNGFRTDDRGIRAVFGCEECGDPVRFDEGQGFRVAFDPKDLPKINAYRERKGWPSW